MNIVLSAEKAYMLENHHKTVTELFDGLGAPGFGLDLRFFYEMGNRLVTQASIEPGASVLDIACGTGSSLIPAAEQAGPDGHVYAIDLSERMVEIAIARCGQHNLGNVTVKQMNACNLSWRDAIFDRVICGFALFFIVDLNSALLEMARVLKPGGAIVAATFSSLGYPWSGYERVLAEHGITNRAETINSLVIEPLEHEKKLKAAFCRAGFSEIEIYTEDYEDNYPDETTWWSAVQQSPDGLLFEGLEEERLEKLAAEARESIQNLKHGGNIRARYQALVIRAINP
jgi:ubiquinone/menaquinone biosynthesis C-methylase UbiE